MSWAGTARCLHCHRRIAIYRRVAGGQFCSVVHRKAYELEQERLAIERLKENQESLVTGHWQVAQERAHKTEGSAGLPLRGLLPPRLFVKDADTAKMIAGDPVEYELGPRRAGFQALAVPITMEEGPALRIHSLAALTSICAADSPVSGNVAPKSHAFAVPPMLPTTAASLDTPELQQQLLRVEPEAVEAAVVEPAVIEPEVVKPVVEEPVSTTFCTRLAKLAPRAGVAAPITVQRAETAPILAQSRVWLPVDGSREQSRMLSTAKLCPIPLADVPLVRGIWVEEFGTLNGGDMAPAVPRPLVPAAKPRLAPGSSTCDKLEPVSGGCVAVAAPAPAATGASVSIPRVAVVLRAVEMAGMAGLAVTNEKSQPAGESIASPSQVRVTPEQTVPAAQLARLGDGGLRPPGPGNGQFLHTTWSGTPRDWKPADQGADGPVPPAGEPLKPRARLEPMRVTPQRKSSSLMDVMRPAEPTLILGREFHVPLLPSLVGFVKHAPRDLKLLALVLPILTALAIHPPLPRVTVAANKRVPSIRGVFENQLRAVRQNIQNRAGIELADDFRSGLDNWKGRQDQGAAWSYDAAGFVKPGALALYSPTMAMADYQMEFLGDISRKAVGWVFRAADVDNYYAVKIVMRKPGPLPVVGVTRYAVIGGKEGPHSDLLLPFPVRTDTLYHVRVEVRGPDYTLSIQDRVVDAWSDVRIKAGGVGFFSGKGEESRIRWVQVSHQYDTIGKLCAFLAAYNMESTSGGFKE